MGWPDDELHFFHEKLTQAPWMQYSVFSTEYSVSSTAVTGIHFQSFDGKPEWLCDVI